MRYWHIKHFLQPGSRQRGKIQIGFAAIGSAFEEEVTRIIANRYEAQLREAGIRIDDKRVGLVHQHLQLKRRKEAISQQTGSAIGNRDRPDALVCCEQRAFFSRPPKNISTSGK